MCFYCDCNLTCRTIQVDHFVSLKEGGPHHYDNWVAACKRCNLRKGHKKTLEFLLKVTKDRRRREEARVEAKRIECAEEP